MEECIWGGMCVCDSWCCGACPVNDEMNEAAEAAIKLAKSLSSKEVE
jgi:hypothetical protein